MLPMQRTPFAMGIARFALVCLLLASPALGSQHDVQLGEITVHALPAGERPAGIKAAFARAIRSEFRQLEPALLQSAARRPLILATALLELKKRRVGKGVETSCVVSATLRDADGAIKALLRGTASVRDEGTGSPESTRLALEAAVQGVMGHVQKAVVES